MATDKATKKSMLDGPACKIHFGGQDYKYPGGRKTQEELLTEWAPILDELNIFDPKARAAHVLGIMDQSATLKAQTAEGNIPQYPGWLTLYFDEEGNEVVPVRQEDNSVIFKRSDGSDDAPPPTEAAEVPPADTAPADPPPDDAALAAASAEESVNVAPVATNTVMKKGKNK